MPTLSVDSADRVLILPPTRRDGEVTCRLLSVTGIHCIVCADLPALRKEMQAGVGAILLTEKTLSSAGIDEFVQSLRQQESWSDLPIVMLLQGNTPSPRMDRLLSTLSNVTLLERPAPTRTVVSAVQAALRARQRQYQIRDQLREIHVATAAMRELQEQYQFAIDASELGTFHCTMPLGTIYWNDRCKQHFWLPPDADVDFDLFYAILHPDDRARVREAVEDCVNDNQPYNIEYRTVSPTGDVRWIRATGRTYFDALGVATRFDGTTVDITAIKASEAVVRDTQERFQAMANSIPQLAWMAHADGTIFWFNQRWHTYFNTTEGENEGWAWTNLLDPLDAPRVVQKWQGALAQGEPWEDNFTLRRHDGEYRWHLSRAHPLRESNGTIQMWFGTNTDVTQERDRAEERQRLLESERAARQEAERASRIKDEFLATLSHELRTPLSAIFGWAQLLKFKPADVERVTEAVEVIDRNVRVQTQLIDDLLDMSRIVSGKVRLNIQQVELADIIRNSVEAVRPAVDAKAIQLENLVDQHIGTLRSDSSRLQQVFWNLLTNAVRFTPKHGRITICATRSQHQIEVRIVDSGEGIEAEFIPHLFERFSQADGAITRRHGGLGLGLSIVKNLVELHGGAVSASSAGQGQGATFVITLPLHDVPSERDLDSHLPSSLASPNFRVDFDKLRGLKVLVVDDEPDGRELIKRFLTSSEAIPALAASAPEAELLVSTFLPDIIVSDIGMPGEDGYAFMRSVRRSGVRTPAIALTAFARSEDRVRSLQAGYHAHLSKPVEPSELLAMIIRLHESQIAG